MDPQKIIWIDTQGSVTHIATIFKFRDVSGPMAKKLPKENRRSKEVKEALVPTHHKFTTTYFDNIWDNMWVQFFLEKKLMNIFDITLKYSKGPPEVDLNGYPRISNRYCRNIQIWRCEWTQGKKITQSKSWIKNSKLFYMYAALLL